MTDPRIKRCRDTLESEASAAEHIARDLFVRARGGEEIDTATVTRELEAARRIRRALDALGATP